MDTVVLLATLDTKGAEVAYLRDRLHDLGVGTIVVDTGILGEPVGIVPDVSHEELALRGGTTIAEVRGAGTRGRAVELMRGLVTDLVVELYARGAIRGGIAVGGVGSVMGAAALQRLPLGAPKVVVAPTASGHHEFGPYVGLKDVFVVHSVVDIAGLNPVLMAVLDNTAAAMAGLLRRGHELAPPAAGAKLVATTMLGNTTTAVDSLRDALTRAGYEVVVFHSNGVGGPAMEDLARTGQFTGVVDYTTNEIYDPLVGGIHQGGPDRLAVVAALGLPQVVLPGCVDFSVWAPASIPPGLRDRPVYEHNPEYTLVRASHDEKAQVGRIFAERVSAGSGPTRIVFPTGGLSIPAVPGGPFWDPEGDRILLESMRAHLRPGIPVEVVDQHINDPRLGELVAARFLDLITATDVLEGETAHAARPF